MITGYRPYRPLALLLLLQLPYYTLLFAQDPLADSALLAEQTIWANKSLDSVQVNESTLFTDSVNLYRNLGELLALQGNNFIRAYSPGLLATTSIRAQGASQTQVLWQGFDVRSPMNGSQDLSLASAQNMTVELLSSGAASNGVVSSGGSLSLAEATPKEGLSLGLTSSIGSFGLHNNQISASIKKGKWWHRLSYQHQGSHNEFSYQNTLLQDRPTQRISNASQRLWSYKQSHGLRINKKLSLTGALWLQESERQIPPTLGELHSEASQNDNAIRSTIGLDYKPGRWKLSLKAFWASEGLGYDDPLDNIHSQSRFNRLSIRHKADRQIGKTLFSLGLQLNRQQANTSEYTGSSQKKMTGYAAWLSAKGKVHKRVSWKALLRQDSWTESGSVWSGSLETRLDLRKYGWIEGIVAKSSRFPALNDLYWLPGGNEGLSPEQGLQLEARYGLNLGRSPGTELRLSLFHNDVSQYIRWQPHQNGYWEATNDRSYLVQGLESSIKSQLKLNKATLKGRLAHTLQIASLLDEAGEWRTPIYVPRNLFSASVSLEYKRLLLSLGHRYTGLRWENSDQSAALPAFQLSDASIAYQIRSNKSWRCSLAFQIRNALDTHYQIISARPMPGQHFLFTVNIKYQNSINTK